MSRIRNAVYVIRPYRAKASPKTWVFDDDRFGLVQEPFVFGASEAIERVVKRKLGAVDQAEIIFAETPLPESDVVLRRIGTGADPDVQGCRYHDGVDELWLCPAMTHYFPGSPAPETIQIAIRSAS